MSNNDQKCELNEQVIEHFCLPCIPRKHDCRPGKHLGSDDTPTLKVTVIRVSIVYN
jgi:hypothetical protein